MVKQPAPQGQQKKNVDMGSNPQEERIIKVNKARKGPSNGDIIRNKEITTKNTFETLGQHNENDIEGIKPSSSTL